MKKTLLLVFLLSATTSFQAQLSDALTNGLNKKKIASALKDIPEQKGRSFFKSGNEAYLPENYSEDQFVYVDNNIYADAVREGEIISIKVFKYFYSEHSNSSDNKTFRPCDINYEDQNDKTDATRFWHLEGDVYGQMRFDSSLVDAVNFIFFNDEQGVYFHYNTHYDEKGDQPGGGFYKPTKASEILSEELAEEKNYFRNHLDTYNKALEAYHARQREKRIQAILSKPDEGVPTAFHKENTGKVLFGNQITDDNKYIASTYKNKFTIDEKISMIFFLDKGLNKYFDQTKEYFSENLSAYNVSSFKVRITYDNSKTEIITRGIKQTGNVAKTSGIIHLIVHNEQGEHNGWATNFLPNKIEDKEHPVMVEVLLAEDENTVLATGTFTYSPKKGAVLPYGVPCAIPADYDASMTKLKPRMKEISDYQMERYNTKNGSQYKIVKFAVIQGWANVTDIIGNVSRETTIKFLCTNEKGESLIFFDIYSATDISDDSIGIFKGLLNSDINLSYCDAK